MFDLIHLHGDHITEYLRHFPDADRNHIMAVWAKAFKQIADETQHPKDKAKAAYFAKLQVFACHEGCLKYKLCCGDLFCGVNEHDHCDVAVTYSAAA